MAFVLSRHSILTGYIEVWLRSVDRRVGMRKNIDGHVMTVYTTYPVSHVLVFKFVVLVVERLTLPAVFYVTI